MRRHKAKKDGQKRERTPSVLSRVDRSASVFYRSGRWTGNPASIHAFMLPETLYT